jgi:tRNA1Val (adenine37-N6)-methyltransferase
MIFKFKQFNVKQSASAMKVGTDSVLLGSLLEANNPQTILDIGTGTGLLTLMMAQRFAQSKIDAVEIDEQAFEEAMFNIDESKWSNRIQIHHQPLQEFVLLKKKHDLIVSNPPYYKAESNYKITAAQRSKARQTETLSFDDLLNGMSHLLTDEGICWVVLPTQESELLIAKAQTVGLYLNSQILIHSKLSKAHNRIVFGLSKTKKKIQQSTFVIYEEDGKYTSQYTEATMPFLLWKD